MSYTQTRPNRTKASEVAGKFLDPNTTADGAPRAQVRFGKLETLWVNTGTLCNIECAHCYIESSPSNDRLSYLTADELKPFLDEAAAMKAREVGFTGGEPFMNPDMPAMAEDALLRGFNVLILTNAMRPMMRPRIKQSLLDLNKRYDGRLTLRVSIDHFTASAHDSERGSGSFDSTLEGMTWLTSQGINFTVAGRLRWHEDEKTMREGFAALFESRGVRLNAFDPNDLILFPEMDEAAPVPEISEACWNILGKDPGGLMCATSRMLVKRKGETKPTVLACTLIPYNEEFEMGASLSDATTPVKLNHPHCAKFCVLGGASCSG